MSATEVARTLSLPRETVRDWIAGSVPRLERGCDHDFAALSEAYAHLLGLYLGDGCLSKHRRDVYKLRITLDVKYPRIIASAAAAMEQVLGRPAAIQRRLHENCVEVTRIGSAGRASFHNTGPVRSICARLNSGRGSSRSLIAGQKTFWVDSSIRTAVGSSTPGGSGSVRATRFRTRRRTSGRFTAEHATYWACVIASPAETSTSPARPTSPSSTPSSAPNSRNP
jgi:hypothetical protein